jgi:hypothetical protein
LPDLSKKGQKGAELFLKFNKAKFLTENWFFYWFTHFSLTKLHRGLLKK